VSWCGVSHIRGNYRAGLLTLFIKSVFVGKLAAKCHSANITDSPGLATPPAKDTNVCVVVFLKLFWRKNNNFSLQVGFLLLLLLLSMLVAT
jgi:hypothetical protein